MHPWKETEVPSSHVGLGRPRLLTFGSAVSCGSSGATPAVTVTSGTSPHRAEAGRCQISCREGLIDDLWLREFETIIRRLHFERRLAVPRPPRSWTPLAPNQ